MECLAFGKFPPGYTKSMWCLIERKLNEETAQGRRNSGLVHSACLSRGVGEVASRCLCYDEQYATFCPLLLLSGTIDAKLLKHESQKLCLWTKMRAQAYNIRELTGNQLPRQVAPQKPLCSRTQLSL